jgi:hypothetical protein
MRHPARRDRLQPLDRGRADRAEGRGADALARQHQSRRSRRKATTSSAPASSTLPGRGDGPLRDGKPEAKKFAILYPNNSDYGVGLRDLRQAAVAKAAAGTVVAEESYAEKADKDFRGQLTKIKAASPRRSSSPATTPRPADRAQARELG